MDKVKIDQLVAEKVMGFTVDKREDSLNKCKIIKISADKNPFNYTYVESFRPSSNIKDAFKVVEKLREHYIFLTLTTGEDSYVAEFTENDINNPDKYITYVAEAQMVSMAICLAALKIVGHEED